MAGYFMGIRTKTFICSSTEGDQLRLMCPDRQCALFTAAELFDMPVSHVDARLMDEWEEEDNVHNHHSMQEVY